MRKSIFLLAVLAIIVTWIASVIYGSAGSIRQTGIHTLYNHTQVVTYGIPVRVARVIDGDTIELADGERLRYIGIDTPEEVDARKPVQCFARQAAERNKELVEGKMVTFYKDSLEHDAYGRLLGFVYLPDGTFVNKLLVTQGYAFAYPYKPDTSHAQEFRSAEIVAKKNNLGLWAQCAVRILRSGREQTNAVE